MADNYLERQMQDYEARRAAIEKKKSEHRKKLMEAYRKRLAEQQKNK
ncbi:MAG: hypothetical protein MJY72_01735 [Bacteroidales bacterium]|nr:hypothetical protein [Bacteroidales bacterium]